MYLRALDEELIHVPITAVEHNTFWHRNGPEGAVHGELVVAVSSKELDLADTRERHRDRDVPVDDDIEEGWRGRIAA